MKNIITHLVLIGLFLSSAYLHAQDKEWTLLVYMVGSDIVDDGIADLNEMKAAGSTENINIVTMLGGSKREGWQTPTTSTLENGEEISQSFVPSIPNMSNSGNITEFLNWGIANYPAKKYMLIFYNHGGDIRGFGVDETTGKINSVTDIQQGIANSDFIKNNNKFELLGFDACLMATFEVQSAFRNFGKYYIASEETEPYHAWNWTPVITAMNAQIGLDGKDLGRLIVDTYLQQSAAEKTEHVTLSVVDLSKITALETALEQLLSKLDDDLYLESFLKARGRSEEYHKVISTPEYSDDMVDIGDLVKHLQDQEPGLEADIANVLAKLKDAVVYEKSDKTRPQATGISMYVPFNVFSDEDETYYVIDENYTKIDFSSTIKNFIAQNYTEFGLADQTPVSGSIVGNFGLKPRQELETRGPGNDVYSAINVADADDLDQVQVVLLEELENIPNEYILLGSSYPDTTVQHENGTTTFAYKWDNQWLSLNGFPAYVADIHHYEVEDENGDFDYAFTRIHIPAILNPGTDEEKEIMMSFVFDDDFNHELEGILREPYGDEIMIPSKERIDLLPNDRVQLIYEIFDTQTNEAFFVPNEQAIIDIQSGNEDLILDHTDLEPGNYHLGFVLMDHAQNDTIIYDPQVHQIQSTVDTKNLEDMVEINLTPNPATDMLRIFLNTPGKVQLQLFNSMGQPLIKREIQGNTATAIQLDQLPAGVYSVHLQMGDHAATRKIIKL